MDVLNTIANLLLIPLLATAVTFVAVYSRTTWWRTEMGRNVMALMTVVVLLVGHGVIARVWLGTDYPGRPAVRVALNLAANFILIWRLSLLLRLRYRADHPPDPPKE